MPHSNKKKKNPVKEKNKIISTSFHEAQGLAYQIIRKKIKSMRLTVLAPDGRVRVSAPPEISDSTVEKFVLSKREWIEKHQERFRNIPKSSVLTERKYISGEPFFLFGKMYVLEVEENKDKNLFSLEIDGELAKFTVRTGSDAAARESFVREWYRVLLKRKDRRTAARMGKDHGTLLQFMAYKIHDNKVGNLQFLRSQNLAQSPACQKAPRMS